MNFYRVLWPSPSSSFRTVPTSPRIPLTILFNFFYFGTIQILNIKWILKYFQRFRERYKWRMQNSLTNNWNECFSLCQPFMNLWGNRWIQVYIDSIFIQGHDCPIYLSSSNWKKGWTRLNFKLLLWGILNFSVADFLWYP